WMFHLSVARPARTYPSRPTARTETPRGSNNRWTPGGCVIAGTPGSPSSGAAHSPAGGRRHTSGPRPRTGALWNLRLVWRDVPVRRDVRVAPACDPFVVCWRRQVPVGTTPPHFQTLGCPSILHG